MFFGIHAYNATRFAYVFDGNHCTDELRQCLERLNSREGPLSDQPLEHGPSFVSSFSPSPLATAESSSNIRSIFLPFSTTSKKRHGNPLRPLAKWPSSSSPSGRPQALNLLRQPTLTIALSMNFHLVLLGIIDFPRFLGNTQSLIITYVHSCSPCALFVLQVALGDVEERQCIAN